MPKENERGCPAATGQPQANNCNAIIQQSDKAVNPTTRLGKFILEYMKIHGYTPNKFRTVTGMDVTSYISWVTKGKVPLPITVYKIAKRLGVAFDELFELVWQDRIDYCVRIGNLKKAETFRNAVFGKALTYYRCRLGINTKEALEPIGIKRDSYFTWEDGRCLPRSTVPVLNLAKVFKVDKDALLNPLMEDIERREQKGHYDAED